MKSLPPNCAEKPQGYVQCCQIDLKNNKKQYLIVMGLSVAIGLLMAAAGALIYFLAIAKGNIAEYIEPLLISVAIALVAYLAYIVLHELTHGICFRAYSGKRAKYGVSLTYAYAYSDYYYNKKSYIIIGLAPVVIFFFVFLAITLALPWRFFWIGYLLQLFNLSGAAGDFYVTAILLKQSDSVLVYDRGIGMEMYSYQPQQHNQEDEQCQQAQDR